MNEPINAFTMAQGQFDQVAKMLNLDPQISEMLRWPMREFKFMIPVNMDDGTMRVFFGYRIQHNDARGPNKGGIRFHPSETLDTVRETGAGLVIAHHPLIFSPLSVASW